MATHPKGFFSGLRIHTHRYIGNRSRSRRTFQIGRIRTGMAKICKKLCQNMQSKMQKLLGKNAVFYAKHQHICSKYAKLMIEIQIPKFFDWAFRSKPFASFRWGTISVEGTLYKWGILLKLCRSGIVNEMRKYATTYSRYSKHIFSIYVHGYRYQSVHRLRIHPIVAEFPQEAMQTLFMRFAMILLLRL